MPNRQMPALAMAIERTLDARASIGCTLPYSLLSATGKILCDESTKTHMPCTIRAMSGRLEAVNQSCILAGSAYDQVRASGPRACTTEARI